MWRRPGGARPDTFLVAGLGLPASAVATLHGDVAGGAASGDALRFNPSSPDPNVPNYSLTSPNQNQGQIGVNGMGIVHYDTFSSVSINSAVTVVPAVTVSWQVPEPLHAPDQPVKALI